MDTEFAGPDFSDPGCQCRRGTPPTWQQPADCRCPATIRALYAYASLRSAMPPMTEPQRTWCIHEVLFAGEGNQDGHQLAAMDDGALAARVIDAYRQLATPVHGGDVRREIPISGG